MTALLSPRKKVRISGSAPITGSRTTTLLFCRQEHSENIFLYCKTHFESSERFDQCGVAMYLDSDNWFKASIEYENEKFQRLGSVVTNHGYSDWATTDIPSDIKEMWYRFSRRESDYCIECSTDGINFKQMRIFHMWEGRGWNYIWNLCMQPDNRVIQGNLLRHENNGMPMGLGWGMARRRIIILPFGELRGTQQKPLIPQIFHCQI